MGDLLNFKGYENTTVSFDWNEFDHTWKSIDRQYHDFVPGDEVNKSCEYPRMWSQEGYRVGQNILDAQTEAGCRMSEFDMVSGG